MAGDALNLTANPAGLAANTIHYATVTLASTDPSVQYTDTIRVGLWIGSAAPSASISLSATYTGVASDPIRPYAYVHADGADLTIYNIYTGAVVQTLHNVAPHLSNMVASTNGSTLYVVDATNYHILPVDLDAYMVGAPWTISPAADAYVAYTRTNGKALVFAGNGQIYDAVSGATFPITFDSGYYGDDAIAASRDGSRICTLELGISPYTATCYAVSYTDMNGGQVALGQGKTNDFGTGSNGQDIAVNADGTRVYVASGAPYVFTAYDAASAQAYMPVAQTLPGDAYPNNVEMADNGDVVCGAAVYYDPIDTWVYDAQGFLVNSAHLGGYATNLLPGQLKVSGDGLRIIGATDTPTLRFVNLGP